jgi:hypothetical protein
MDYPGRTSKLPNLSDHAKQELPAQTVTEQNLIEALAYTKTKQKLFHSVEDSLLHLAQEQARSPDQMVNSFSIDDPSDLVYGIKNLNHSPRKELLAELLVT